MFRFTLLILLILSNKLIGQNYAFTSYGVKEGLAQTTVSGFVQDSAGFLWFATDGGLSRFDGKTFKNFTSDDGLANNNISAIFLDSKNYIWLGHENGNITRYDGARFTKIHSKLLPEDKKIYDFFQDRKGSLWIGSFSKGAVCILNPSEKDVQKLKYKAYDTKNGLSNYVFSIIQDKEGLLWFVTDVGIKIYNPTTLKFSDFDPSKIDGQISSISKDKDNNILIGSTKGAIYKYKTKSKETETLISPTVINGIFPSNDSPKYVYVIFLDSKNNIWISYANNGILRYNLLTKEITHFNTTNGLMTNKIKYISEDREGNILIGTLGEGFAKLSGERFVSYSAADGLNNNEVSTICEDDFGNYWFGTNEGISVFNPRAMSGRAFKYITVKNGLSSNRTRSIVKDKSGNLWIASWGGGVKHYDVKTGKFIHHTLLEKFISDYELNLISCLIIDSNNNLWIGSYNGLVCFNLNTEKIKYFNHTNGLIDHDVSCLLEDNTGRIWIGTHDKGVSVFNGKCFENFNHRNGLKFENISAMAEDHKGQIWIGTNGGGVYVFAKRKFKNYKAVDGLNSDFVMSILVDDNNLIWFGTNNGLTKYIPSTKTFHSYDEHEGFRGGETRSRAVYKDGSKNLWFGTQQGVFKYNSEKDLKVTVSPATHFQAIRVNRKVVPLTNTINLNYNQNSISIDFLGISLSNPYGVKYSYKLEGYDKEWKTTSTNTIDYDFIEPGEYSFKVLSCNSSGTCNNIPVSLKISIHPPFWQTWLFRISVALLFVIFIWLFIKSREKKLRAEKQKLEDTVELRTKEVVEEKNKVQMQKHLIEEKHREITDSINYAERIQRSFMATKKLLDTNLPDYFVLFQPKDVVSGDFYWAAVLNNGEFALATADSTGHGVPGAIMSILNISSLEKSIEQSSDPSEILNSTRKIIIERLMNDGSAEGGKDGMDASLISLNFKKATLTYAAANNPIWIVREGKLIELLPDNMPVGKHARDSVSFTKQVIMLQKNDLIYTLTDGYPDQFGGPKGKKFMYKKLKEFLVGIALKPLTEQNKLLSSTLVDWKGGLEQVDDICIIGIRV